MSDEQRGAGAPTEEERARAIREQLKSLHAFDLAYEMMISLVSFGYQKMGLTDETRELRDLGDARLAIELLRANLEVVEREQGEGRTRDVRSTLAGGAAASRRAAGRRAAGRRAAGGRAGCGRGCRQGARGRAGGATKVCRQEARREKAGRQEDGGEEAGRQEAGGEEAGRQEAGGEEAGRQEAGGQEAARRCCSTGRLISP
jgi:hypothetical protein